MEGVFALQPLILIVPNCDVVPGGQFRQTPSLKYWFDEHFPQVAVVRVLFVKILTLPDLQVPSGLVHRLSNLMGRAPPPPPPSASQKPRFKFPFLLPILILIIHMRTFLFKTMLNADGNKKGIHTTKPTESPDYKQIL
jgi:hypothetical protein